MATREDIPLLGWPFLQRFAERQSQGGKRFYARAMDLLIHYDWRKYS
ncbi:hypothetical protein ACVXHB_02450 [Escherichia coli]